MTDGLRVDGDAARSGWARLEPTIARFERAWWLGTPPEIDDYLPVSGLDRRALLRELVLIDQEFRRSSGASLPADHYMYRYPELSEEDAIATERLTPDRARPRHAGGTPLTSPEPRPLPSHFGKFRLIEQVGRGSFGVVYRAIDAELGRVVALKVPRGEIPGSAEDKERFLREARSAGRLSHPGIVRIFEAGRIEGQPYLVAEFIAGTTLADRLRDGPLPPSDSADLLASIAEALEHAHEGGIIHRDLKPANILIDGQGRPRLTDFGLARPEGVDVTLTVDGQILGTPAYMSPEQALGEARRVDARSDIYSLGVVLYQALTGELPYRGSARMILGQILHEEPRPPRALNHLVPPDLETICLKAMARLPSDRYPSSAALARDLRLYLRGEPILARPMGAAGRLWRRARRQPMLSGLTTALILAIGLGTAGATSQWLRARAALRSERRQSQRALAALTHANRVIVSLTRDVIRDDRAPLTIDDDRVKSVVASYESYLAKARSEVTSPAKSMALAERSLAHFNHGMMLSASGRADEAERDFLRAAARCEERLRMDPVRLGLRSKLSHAHLQLARIHRAQGRWAEVVRDYERRAALLAGPAVEGSANPQTQETLAATYINLGEARIEAGAPGEALHDLRRGLAMLEGPAWTEPPSIERRKTLAKTHVFIGRALDRLNRPAEAAESFLRALSLCEGLACDEPANASHRRLVGMVHHVLGNLSLDLDRPADAIVRFRKALDIRERLVRDDHGEGRSRQDCEGTRRNLDRALDLLSRNPPIASAPDFL